MGRRPCCSKEQQLNKGAWTALEDTILTHHINLYGQAKWRNIPKLAGLNRCGKSCKLRWLNYLRPDIIRGNINPDEEDLIVRLHKLLGNRWSLIAGRLPGRTDNEIKNYWNTVLSKKSKASFLDQKMIHVDSKVEAPPVEQNETSGNFVNTGTDEKSSSSDFAMDFNQLVGDIDLSEFFNADNATLDGGLGSLELFVERADEEWMI